MPPSSRERTRRCPASASSVQRAAPCNAHSTTHHTTKRPQAYRRLALIKHPDKAKTPNAAAEFAELQKAYAVLCDPDARSALDDYIRFD